MINNPLVDTLKWFQVAVETPTDNNKLVQIGCNLEEVAEQLDAIGLKEFGADVHRLGDFFKGGRISIDQLTVDRKELLDALADQIVTSVGVAHMYNLDIVGALGEVNRSNWSKFVGGKPVFKDNGKIGKGPNYSEPDLSSFVN